MDKQIAIIAESKDWHEQQAAAAIIDRQLKARLCPAPRKPEDLKKSGATEGEQSEFRRSLAALEALAQQPAATPANADAQNCASGTRPGTRKEPALRKSAATPPKATTLKKSANAPVTEKPSGLSPEHMVSLRKLAAKNPKFREFAARRGLKL